MLGTRKRFKVSSKREHAPNQAGDMEDEVVMTCFGKSKKSKKDRKSRYGKASSANAILSTQG